MRMMRNYKLRVVIFEPKLRLEDRHFRPTPILYMSFCVCSVSLREASTPNRFSRVVGQPLWAPRPLNYHTLISTSTPEGSSSFISASIVLGVDE